jgi:hypothetical protein
MKTPSIAVLLCIVAIHLGFSQSHAEQLADHYERIRSFHPRLEGSAGEDETLSYIEEVAAARGLALSTRDFGALDDAHSFSRNARVNLPGVVPGRLFILVPVNHAPGAPPSADGSVNIAAALTLLELWAEESGRPSLSFVFLGADTAERALGTRLFLEQTVTGGRSAALYLDVSGPGERVTLELGGSGPPAPRWLAEAGVRALVESGLPRRQHLSSLQVARSPLARPTVLDAYLERDLPALRLRDASAGPAFTSEGRPVLEAEWARGYVTFLEEVTGRAAPPETRRWDRHYLYATVGEGVFFVGEQAYLVLLLAVLASPIIYGLAFRRRLRRYATLVARNAWALLVLAVLAFFFFFVATALMRGIMDFRDFPTLWQYAPGSYFILKLLISVLLFAVVFQSLRGLPFPRNGSFYSAAAIFLLFVDIVILSVFDIAFTFYFLWAFLFAFLFSLTRRPWLKALVLLATPVWIIVGLVELFAAGEVSAAEALLLAPVTGNLIFAVVLLPFLLMLIRVDLMLHRRLRLPHGATLRATITGSAAAAVLFALALVFLEPFSPERPQPVEATEVIDLVSGTHRLELRSPAPLDGLILTRGDATYAVDGGGRSHVVDLTGIPRPITVDTARAEFLSRSRRSLTVGTELSPYLLELSLSSADEILIFDADYPVSTDGEGRRAEFAVGPFPPNPLTVNFTVPRDIHTVAEIELVSNETIMPLESRVDGFELHPRTRIIATVSP